VTLVEGRFPKLMRRMPPLPQRRNAAYLNRRISRFGRVDRGMKNQELMSYPGLAIDLAGSLDQRFRPGALGAAYLDGPLSRLRRLNEENFSAACSLLLN